MTVIFKQNRINGLKKILGQYSINSFERHCINRIGNHFVEMSKKIRLAEFNIEKSVDENLLPNIKVIKSMLRANYRLLVVFNKEIERSEQQELFDIALSEEQIEYIKGGESDFQNQFHDLDDFSPKVRVAIKNGVSAMLAEIEFLNGEIRKEIEILVTEKVSLKSALENLPANINYIYYKCEKKWLLYEDNLTPDTFESLEAKGYLHSYLGSCLELQQAEDRLTDSLVGLSDAELSQLPSVKRETIKGRETYTFLPNQENSGLFSTKNELFNNALRAYNNYQTAYNEMVSHRNFVEILEDQTGESDSSLKALTYILNKKSQNPEFLKRFYRRLQAVNPSVVSSEDFIRLLAECV